MWTIGRWVAGALGGMLGVAPPAEVSSPTEVDLEWRAPAGCPDVERMKVMLAAALGSEGDSLRVAVEVTGTAGETFRAEVLLQGPWGDSARQLQSPTCETLADAVVLLAVVSVQQGESEVLVVPEPEPESEPDPEPGGAALEATTDRVAVREDEGGSAEPAARMRVDDAKASTDDPSASGWVPSRAADAEPSTEASSTWEGLTRLAIRAGGGILPRSDLSAALAVGLSRRWWRAELLGAGWLPRDEPIAADAAVRIHLVTGALRGCGQLRPRPWLGVLPCADLEVGAMRGQGRGAGLVVGRVSWQVWVSVALTPALAFRVHPRVSVFASGSLVVPLRRPGFQLQDTTGDVYRVPRLSGRGALGVELYWP
ncbi:MAG: hypothetical protein AAGF11_43450 [Myxococcota bacterium]